MLLLMMMVLTPLPYKQHTISKHPKFHDPVKNSENKNKKTNTNNTGDDDDTVTPPPPPSKQHITTHFQPTINDEGDLEISELWRVLLLLFCTP